MDYVDILYLHYWDWTVKPEEVMKALEDIVIRPGKALHLAISDAPAFIVTRCNTIAEWKGVLLSHSKANIP
jgi:aryl-alcohol dehydrogenase-like predicted oxidoreductase